MTVTVVPTLTVAGLAVPRSGSGTLVAVEELRIGWGRSSVLEQLTPATATVTLRDTSFGYTFARRTDLVGQPVTFGYSGSGLLRTTFRGRITDVEIHRRPAGGMLVTLACSSKLVDCANYLAPNGTAWPGGETLQQRLNRIMALLPAGFFAAAPLLPAAAAGYTVAPATVTGAGGSDVLSLLRQLYASAGLVLSYDPDVDQLIPYTGLRQTYWGSGRSYLAQLTAREVGGQLVQSPQPVPLPNGEFGSWLRYDALRYDGPVESPMDSRITRVEVGYKNSAASYAAATITAQVDPVETEAVVGRRTLSLDTILSAGLDATTVALTVSGIAGKEARSPQLGVLTFETARAGGGFPDSQTLRMLLSGYPTGLTAFVRGTWPAAVGVRPHFGVLAATLSYAGGQWTVGFTPEPVAADGTLTPLTPNTAAATTATRLRDVDPFVTLADLAFVELGAGVTPT